MTHKLQPANHVWKPGLLTAVNCYNEPCIMNMLNILLCRIVHLALQFIVIIHVNLFDKTTDVLEQQFKVSLQEDAKEEAQSNVMNDTKWLDKLFLNSFYKSWVYFLTYSWQMHIFFPTVLISVHSN